MEHEMYELDLNCRTRFWRTIAAGSLLGAFAGVYTSVRLGYRGPWLLLSGFAGLWLSELPSAALGAWFSNRTLKRI